MGIKIEALVVSTHDSSFEHPRTPRQAFENILGLLISLQQKPTRFHDLEQSVADEFKPNPDDPLILDLSFRVLNDPENPDRVVTLGPHKFLGFHLDEMSKEWKADLQLAGVNKPSPTPFPIVNIVLS